MNYHYEIKKLNSSNSKYFYDAMRVYCDNTPDEIYTNQNEMVEFLNLFNSEEAHKHYYFALLLNETVVGFSDIVYIKAIPMLLIDYFTIKESHKKNCIFYTFLNMLFSYFSEQKMPFQYVVTEISNKNNGKEIDIDSSFFKILSRGENFKEIKAVYKHPQLGNNSESKIDCKLLIKSSHAKDTLNKDTYLRIVREIYDHYISWYSCGNLSGQCLNEYKTTLYKYFTEIQTALEKSQSIPLVDYDAFGCKYYESKRCTYYTDGDIPTNKPNIFRKVFEIILSISVVTIISIVLQFLLSKYMPQLLILPYIPTIVSSLFIAIFLSRK